MRSQTKLAHGLRGRVAVWAVTVGLGLTVGATPALAQETFTNSVEDVPAKTVEYSLPASESSVVASASSEDAALASVENTDDVVASSGDLGGSSHTESALASEFCDSNFIDGDSGGSTSSLAPSETGEACVSQSRAGEAKQPAGGTISEGDSTQASTSTEGETDSPSESVPVPDTEGASAATPTNPQGSENSVTNVNQNPSEASDSRSDSETPATPSEEREERVVSYRLYNPWSGEHLFTTSKAEYDDLVKVGWNGEGEAWESPASSLSSVYRLYNPYSGDHLFVTSEAEYENLQKVGWRGEGVAFYSDDAHGLPIYRMFNPYVSVGTHLYTKSAEERLVMASNGWRTEGIGWWGFAAKNQPAWSEGWTTGEDGSRYFGSADGTFVQDSWAVIDGASYHFDSDGRLSQGLRLLDDTYYLFKDGHTVSGWQEFGGHRYLFGADGTPQTGWVEENGSPRFLDRATFQMRTGWLNDDGATYYLDTDGAPCTGWQTIANNRYHFDATTGAMTKGWLQEGSAWYYLDASTGAAARGWKQVGPSWYYFNPSTGAMSTGWLNDGGSWYYLSDTGIMQTGWLQLNGSWYYLDPNGGAMFTGTHVIDGYTRSFTVNGVCTNAGYQNPYPYYAVNGLPVQPKVKSGIFSYVSPLRIGYNATRSQCVEAFISTAMGYIGTPYVWDYACAPGVGVDCAGLVLQCMYSVGMNPTRYSPWDHYNTPGHNHYANDMRYDPQIKKVSKGSLQRGDLLFWPGHVAIYVGGGNVIEAAVGSVSYGRPYFSISSAVAVGRLFV